METYCGDSSIPTATINSTSGATTRTVSRCTATSTGISTAKSDEYRWLGTAGSRWAIDTNEDGRIDRWKVISPEEVSEEMIAALSTRDAERFRCLLLTDDEFRGLRLAEPQAAELGKKIADTTVRP